MHRIPVRQIMQTTVVSVHPNALIADAAQLMEDFNVRRLPVVDDEDHLVGIVTDSDIREAEMAGSVMSTYEPGVDVEWLTVADIMTPEVITIGPDATVGELAAILAEHKVGGVPVVVPDAAAPKYVHVVGIVTEVDIFSMIAAAWKAESQAQV